MTTLVIPDVHENIDAVRRAINNQPFDRAVFLGDWFDRFPSRPGYLLETLDWLRDAVLDEDFTFLYGNHDLPYAFDHPMLECTGHQKYARQLFSFFHSDTARRKFKLFTEVDGWILSHAGFAAEVWSNWDEQKVLSALAAGDMHPHVAPGRARGGLEAVGGVTWLDCDREFKPIPGIKQIFGHTQHSVPVRKGDNWCLDAGLRYYGMIREGKLTILNIDGSIWQDI